jgi:hypothetical protein
MCDSLHETGDCCNHYVSQNDRNIKIVHNKFSWAEITVQGRSFRSSVAINISNISDHSWYLKQP